MPAKREVRCGVCGTINRVPGYSIRKIPQCGKCRALLSENAAIRILRGLHRWRRFPILLLILASPIAFIALIVLGSNLATTITPSRTINACTAQPQPREGIYRWYRGEWGDDIAELTIKTTSGSNYFIRLADMSGRPARAYFMHGGATQSFSVPLGTFMLKYAAGNAWCDEQQLFGDDTVYSEASESFTFDQRPGYYPTHWTVELILQPHGNLRTRRITRAEFDGP